MINDLIYAGMLIFVYGVLVFAIFRFTRVIAAHDRDLEELDQGITTFETELERLSDYERQRQMEIDAIESEIATLTAKVGDLDKSLGGERLKARTRVYLGSDRRGAQDHEYLIKVLNDRLSAPTRPPVFAGSWVHGRTYVMWAPSAEAARIQAESRFPQSAHFSIIGVEKSPFGLADRHIVKDS